MPFHVDYETPLPVAQRAWRSPRAVALTLTIALVAGLAYYLGTRDHDTSSATPGESGAGTVAHPSAGAATAPAASLPRGLARAGGGGRQKLYDVPVGYTHDQTGAIQAATNYAVALTGVSYFVRQSRHEIQRYLYAPHAVATPISDEAAAATARSLGINDAGQVIDPTTGDINPQLSFTANCYPVYGAYSSLATGSDEERARIWMPCIGGAASDDDTSQLRVDWMLADVTVRWSNGDWRIYDHKVQTGPSPTNVTSWRDVNVSYAERGRLITDPRMTTGGGSAWTLYANATEEPLPYVGGRP